MSLKYFKDWVIDDQELAREQQCLNKYIQMEEKIQDETAARKPRISRRIAQKKKVNDTINAYTAYLSSLPMESNERKK